MSEKLLSEEGCALRSICRGSPYVLVPLLAPELLEPVLAVAVDPAAGEVHQQVAVPVAHVVAALDVGVEFALRIDADVVADEAVL